MPRYVNRIRSPLDTETRQQRARSYRTFRLGTWIDPYPNIFGSRPEKMVFAKLTQYQIPFNFQSFFQILLPDVDINWWRRLDFIIPDAKIVIEVQGAYWHSPFTNPEQASEDAFKATLLEEMGYTVLAWWDYEIEANLDLLILSEPRLRALIGKGGRRLTGHEVPQIDDSKGIRTANRNRTDYGKRQARYSTIGTKKGKSIYSYGII